MFKCNFSVYEGNEKYLFISYAHKDSDLVYPIIEHMNEAGYRIWFDDGITPGSEWPEYIATHLEKCETFIFFASPNSVASENCKREINFALSRNKKFFTVSLVPTELTLGLELQISTQQNILMYEYKDISKFYDTLFLAPPLAGCKRTDISYPASSIISVSKENVNIDSKNVKKSFFKSKKTLLIAGIICIVLLALTGVLFFLNSDSGEITLENGLSVYKDTSYLSFPEGTVLTKNDISKLRKLKNVESMEFIKCNVPDAKDLASANFIKNVTELSIDSCVFSDYSFLSQMTSLDSLIVSNSDFADDVSLIPNQSLTEMQLTNAGSINLNGLSTFSNLESLFVSDSELAPITEPLPQSLCQITLSNCNLTDTEFMKASDFSFLTSLDLSGNDISDISFLEKYYDYLSCLNLSDTSVNSDSMSVLQCCTGLTSLKLNRVPLEDLSIISSMNNLEELDVSGCGLTSLSNGNLSVKPLTRLVLSNNNLTSVDELSTLNVTAINQVSVLDISNNKITSVASLPSTEYTMFATYGNNIDFTQKDNLDFLKNGSFWDLFVNYFDGLENANVSCVLMIVDGTSDDQDKLAKNGCTFICHPASASYVSDALISTDYDPDLW